MKKSFSKIKMVIALTLVFALSFISIPNVNAWSYDGSETGVVFVEDLLADPDFDAYITDRLIEYLGENALQIMENQEIALETAMQIENSFKRSRNGSLQYPEHIGGMYIGADGNLVVQIVESTERRAYAGSLEPYENVSIEYVKFSHDELLNAWQTIYDYMVEWSSTNSTVAYNFEAAIIDTKNNVLNVHLVDTSQREIEMFTALVVDHPALVFIQVPRDSCQDETTVEPGGAIYSSSGATQSIGYRATRSGKLGFVTTRHDGSNGYAVGEKFYTHWLPIYRTLIGSVTASSSTTDSVFVELASSISMSDVSSNLVTVPIGTTVATPRVGMAVTRIGSGGSDSPDVSVGEITSLNANFNGVAAITADYESSPGDSGSVVIYRVVKSYAHVVGIHLGSYTGTLNKGISPASNINTSLNVQPN